MKQITINPVIETTSMAHLTENVVYLMGLSFVLGSLFTIFTLLLLDFMRRDQAKH
jgi:hypothetical protein